MDHALSNNDSVIEEECRELEVVSKFLVDVQALGLALGDCRTLLTARIRQRNVQQRS